MTKGDNMEFDYSEDATIAEKRRSAIFQAGGAFSMCWSHVEKAGVFHSEKAVEIGEALQAELSSLTEEENAK